MFRNGIEKTAVSVSWINRKAGAGLRSRVGGEAAHGGIQGLKHDAAAAYLVGDKKSARHKMELLSNITKGFKKHAASPLKMPTPHVNPITTQDALGASKALPFSKAISQFGSGNHPKGGLKAMSQVRRA